MNEKTEYVASFSGGKDSTAMVLRMIELGEQLDEVVFCDTGYEFPAMYDHIAKVREAVESASVRFTVLKSEISFDDYFLAKPINSDAVGTYHGYGWPKSNMRWCTAFLKTRLIDRHLKGREVIQCTGLAADELKRLQRQNNLRHRHPLVDWGWSEAMCLGYCYGKGYDWYDPSVGKGLYELFDRTSCWICPFGRLDAFRKLRKHYPELWEKIGRMEFDLRQSRESEGLPSNAMWAYKSPTTWKQFDSRFAAEDSALESQKVLEAFI